TIDAPAGLTADLALRCFSTLESWIRDLKEPAPADLPPGVQSIAGASVTLRFDGAIIGRGDVLVPAGITPRENPFLTAARDAWKEARARIPEGNDAFAEDRRRLFAADIQISLQLTEAPRVINPLSFEEIDLSIARGLDGVAVRIGDRVEPIFPAAMVERDLSPGDALAACASRAAGDPTLGIRTNPLTQPPALVKSHEAAFYAFRPLHLAQAAPGEPARFLHRGGRVVPARDLTSLSMRQWADGIAARLIDLTIIEPLDDSKPPHPDAEGRICLRLPGTYHAATGKFDPEFATIRQQGLVAAALTRYARIVEKTSPPNHERARNVAIRLLRDILEHIPGGPPNAESDEAAIARDLAFQFLHQDLVYEQSFRPWHEKQGLSSITRWDQILTINRLTPLEEKSPARAISWSARGELAMALAIRKSPQAADHIRDVFRQLSVARLHEAMPWIGYAELTLASATEPGPSIALMREWREEVYGRMFPMAPLGFDDADLSGGISAARGLPPTAESARSVAFLARMLGDERLTDRQEFPKELSRLLSALRFLRQLTIDEFATYAAASPRQSRWGVRRAPWDLRLDPEDSAI
ncbi:MAG TPA: hypothetical protein VK176_12250, partial [Phycisphaerales bacterium]|nr:hypothetical protein [Phycisphaerales bacterium]